MEKIIRLLIITTFLLGTISLAKSEEFAYAMDYLYESNYKEAVKLLELDTKNNNTGEAEMELGIIYSGYNIDDDKKYMYFIDSLNLTFEDRMKLSEKYLLSAIDKGNIETSYVYLCYIYALQKKYDLSEKYFEKFREYRKKYDPPLLWMDERTLRMTGNELKAALVYRIIIEDEEIEYPLELIEELIAFYPPNYNILIKYTLKSIENGNTELIGDLGRFYHKNGDLSEAEKYYRIFIEIFNTKNSRFNNLDDRIKKLYIKELEKVLNDQGRKLDNEYTILLKELEKK